MRDIVVVGNSVLDVCAAVDATMLAVGHHHIAPVVFRPGGGMPNVARSLDAAGLRSIRVGAVGDDAAGAALASLMPTAPHVCCGSSTEMSVILMQPDRTIINNDADCWMDTTDALAMVPDNSVVALAYVNKCCIRPEDVPEFCQTVRTRDCTLVGGLNGAFSDAARQLILETGPQFRVVVMNAIEAVWLTEAESQGAGIERLDVALDRLSEQDWPSIVTLGKYGAVCVGPEGRAVAPTALIENAATLGAGDAFLAGVAAGLSLELGLPHCAAVGNSVARHVLSGTSFAVSAATSSAANLKGFGSVAELLEGDDLLA